MTEMCDITVRSRMLPDRKEHWYEEPTRKFDASKVHYLFDA